MNKGGVGGKVCCLALNTKSCKEDTSWILISRRVPGSPILLCRKLYGPFYSPHPALSARGRRCNGDVKMLHKRAVRKCMGAVKLSRIPLKGQYGANVLSMHIASLQ